MTEKLPTQNEPAFAMTEKLPTQNEPAFAMTEKPTPRRHREALFKPLPPSVIARHSSNEGAEAILGLTRSIPQAEDCFRPTQNEPAFAMTEKPTPIRHREALFKRRCRSDPRPHPQDLSGRRLLQADSERTGLRNDGETYPRPSSRGTLQTKVPKRSSASPAGSLRPKIASGRPRTNRPSQ